MNNIRKLFILLTVINLSAIEIPKIFIAKFTQNIYQNDKKLTYKGIVILKNNQIYWQYNYPTLKKIWIKDKVYVYEPDLMQVTILKRPSLNLVKILKNAKKVKDNLYETEMNKKRIYFIYKKTLKKIYYKNEIGNRVEIYFTPLNKNLSIPKMNFPPDIDIIYQN
jgi:outer membrane lipoprotein carrier protein